MSDFQHDFLRYKAMAFLRSVRNDFSRGDDELVVFMLSSSFSFI